MRLRGQNRGKSGSDTRMRVRAGFGQNRASKSEPRTIEGDPMTMWPIVWPGQRKHIGRLKQPGHRKGATYVLREMSLSRPSFSLKSKGRRSAWPSTLVFDCIGIVCWTRYRKCLTRCVCVGKTLDFRKGVLASTKTPVSAHASVGAWFLRAASVWVSVNTVCHLRGFGIPRVVAGLPLLGPENEVALETERGYPVGCWAVAAVGGRSYPLKSGPVKSL